LIRIETHLYCGPIASRWLSLLKFAEESIRQWVESNGVMPNIFRLTTRTRVLTFAVFVTFFFLLPKNEGF